MEKWYERKKIVKWERRRLEEDGNGKGKFSSET
jgi:hypothetical protein